MIRKKRVTGGHPKKRAENVNSGFWNAVGKRPVLGGGRSLRCQGKNPSLGLGGGGVVVT